MNWHIVLVNDTAFAIVPPGGDLAGVRDSARAFVAKHHGPDRLDLSSFVHVKEAPLLGCDVIPARHMFLIDPTAPKEA